MRRLAEGAAKRAYEVRLGDVGHSGQARYVERLGVGAVDGIAGPEHAAVQLLDGAGHPKNSGGPLDTPPALWLNDQPMLTDHSTRPVETREKILQAAFTVLSRQGYENTSIKDIAEEAGVAQGLVHYHYKSKQQLVLAVLEFVCQKVELGEVQGEAGALRAFEDTKLTMKTSRDANSLYVQLIGVGLHDALVGAGIRDFIRSERAHIAELAGQVLGERGQTGPARGIAGVVWAAVLGIMIQSLVDPEFDADEAVDTLAAMSLTANYPGGS